MLILPPDPRERVPSPLGEVDGNGDVSSSVLSVAAAAAVFVPGSVGGRVDDPVVLAAAASVLTALAVLFGAVLHGVVGGDGHRAGDGARERPDRVARFLLVFLVLSGVVGAVYLFVGDGSLGFAGPGDSGGVAPEAPHEISACTTIDDPGR